ncbi:hypothetical protein [Mycolicibacterium smegmatis]|uniref:hypothetical protein n=1 Tax=Mycolicibacterium smegmatis TaxID=1772 RepID=UPI001E5FCD07|nr:hypothetical protein [Mycolicibacterium smegmatis]
MTRPRDTVIRYPVVGSTTLAVVAEVALMEATVHLLDLAAAVGGVEPSGAALTATRDLLVAVPDPVAIVEVLAGRREPAAAVPAIHRRDARVPRATPTNSQHISRLDTGHREST